MDWDTARTAGAARTDEPSIVSRGAGARPIEDGFDLIVFLTVPTALRMARLMAREQARHGSVDTDFMAWAAAYDDAGPAHRGRSRARHEHWLAARACPVLRIDGDVPTAAALQRLSHAVTTLAPHCRPFDDGEPRWKP